MRDRRAVIVPAIALVIGTGIAYIDSRTTWDDAGITAGAVFFAALLLSVVKPSRFWLVGLAVGLPVLVMNVMLHSNFGSVLAVGISMVGSLLGFAIGRELGSGDRAGGVTPR